MSIDYVIHYNLAIKEALAPFFEARHMWDIRPHHALSFSASSTEGNDAALSSRQVKTLESKEFLQILFSAMPRYGEFGNLVGFARGFFAHLRERGDAESLIDLTNYIFKSLSLSDQELPPLLAERCWRLCRELHYWANQDIHALRSSDPAYRQLPETLELALQASCARELPRDVVFIFLTSAYLANLEYWLDLYQQHDPRAEQLCILLIGDDFAEPVEDWLARRGAGGAHVLKYNPPMKLGVCGNGSTLDFLWYIKIHVVRFLLERGTRVIYSDLDAYWIKNYFALRAAVTEDISPDMIVSVTYDMPRSVVADQGFTSCAGFFSVDPTPGGKAILASWCRLTEIMFDDQIAFAELLSRHGAAWQPQPSDIIGATTDIMTQSGVAARIVLLDQAAARRVGLPDPSTIGGATIWHPRWVMAPEQHKDAIRLVAERSHKD